MGIHQHEAGTKTERLIQAIKSLEAAIKSLSYRVDPGSQAKVPVKQEKDK